MPAFWLRCCVVLWALLRLWAPAGAAPGDVGTRVTLSAAQARADLPQTWAATTVLAEPAGGPEWGLTQVLQRRAQFASPTVPLANFGVRRHPMWLHLPLQLDGGDGRWVMQIDYASLNRVDLYHLRDGQLVARHRLGNQQPYAARPMPSRAHAVALQLAPGARDEVFLRVQTESSMLVPISLHTPPDFLAQESAMQLLHGLVSGISLTLLLYALVYWASLRDTLFLSYSVLLMGVGTFFLSYYGLGQQYLWSQLDGLFTKTAPLAVLVAVLGGSQFVRLALQEGQKAWVRHALNTVSALSVLSIAASLLGLLDYRGTHLAATMLGPLPMLLGAPHGWHMARQGHAIARMLLLGWLAYVAGAMVLAALIRGVVPANFAMQHAFQFATLAEMVLWMRVLGLRIEDVRRQAERVQAEKQVLLSLAQTDALTGLPNRRGLSLALDAALPPCRADQALGVFLLDLDGFKPVNDRLGHDAGDELLVLVGQRLKAQLRSGDLVARLGGDEFVIMAAGLSGEADAQRLGSKLLRAFDAPFSLSRGQHCRVGLTIGFALAPQDGREAGDLLKRADAAMYAGKQAGRHCVRRGGASVSLAGV